MSENDPINENPIIGYKKGIIKNQQDLRNFQEWFYDNIDQIYTLTEPFDLDAWIKQSKNKETDEEPR